MFYVRRKRNILTSDVNIARIKQGRNVHLFMVYVVSWLVTKSTSLRIKSIFILTKSRILK